MMWQWLFALVYAVTSGAEFLVPYKKRVIPEFLTSGVVLTVVFFWLFNAHNEYAMLISILTFRFVILIGELIHKAGLSPFYRTVNCLSIDASFLLLRFGEIFWQYMLLSYLILFCLVCLTPYFKSRSISMDFILNMNNRPIAKSAAAFLPLISVCLSIVTFFFLRSESDRVLAFSFVLLLLFSVSILLLQEFLLQALRLRELNRAMEDWQIGARDYMNTIRTQRHDFNIHLHAISGLISGGDFTACQSYIQKLVDEANDINELMPVYDSAIGSMLAEMRKKARRKGTDIHYDIKYNMKYILCSTYECNKIIGNLIRNAIDAVKSEEDKLYGIYVSVIKRHGNTVIIVENRCEKEPDEMESIFDPGYTTKKGHEGLGLAMVEKTLTRYGGKIHVDMYDRIIRFVVHIPNKFTQEEE
ncbi:MAG: GHKL domain-containing protein [Lachnospiraceae bacterium]|nr:GHKL domain-containing protein [Lachnospiraceae bacterium]